MQVMGGWGILVPINIVELLWADHCELTSTATG